MEKKVGKKVGIVSHWYDKIGVAVVKLERALKRGDKVTVRRGEEEFEDIISSIQIDHKDVASAGKGDEAAVKLSKPAKEGATVSLAE